MGKIIAEATVVPLGTASASLSAYVAEAEKVLKRLPKIKSMLTPIPTMCFWDHGRQTGGSEK